jgi:hypothetical protein
MRKADVDTTPQIETDVDDLYKLPVAEFTAARNSLAARLKKAGLIEEANRVKSLGKPSISAWTVNQLFWKQRDSFEQLMTAGERVGQAHALQLAGKTADTRGALATRRDALTNLARLAESLLRDSGHSPTPETIRRITTTLEALSSRSSMEQNHRPGRLSEDVDPPGFESLAALMPVAERIEVSKSEPPKKEVIPPAVAAARAALAAAEETLRLARGRTQNSQGRWGKRVSTPMMRKHNWRKPRPPQKLPSNEGTRLLPPRRRRCVPESRRGRGRQGTEKIRNE